MSAISLIMKYADRLLDGEVFVTRHLLSLATRGALDQALHRLVKNGFLLRVARGVFCKKIEGMKLPKIENIVRVKARAFGKTIAIHGKDALKELAKLGEGNEQIRFASNGKSSSFVVLGVRVYLDGTTMNRVAAGDTKPGLALRAMSELKRERLVPKLVSAICSGFSKAETRKIKKEVPPLMTGWMSDLVVHSGAPLGIT